MSYIKRVCRASLRSQPAQLSQLCNSLLSNLYHLFYSHQQLNWGAKWTLNEKAGWGNIYIFLTMFGTNVSVIAIFVLFLSLLSAFWWFQTTSPTTTLLSRCTNASTSRDAPGDVPASEKCQAPVSVSVLMYFKWQSGHEHNISAEGWQDCWAIPINNSSAVRIHFKAYFLICTQFLNKGEGDVLRPSKSLNNQRADDSIGDNSIHKCNYSVN